ncbi:hypothetical protein TNCV_4112131 [Trichonephila clavipes]|nr:hypothetical protein TNCV_4112131 [Trichonephila clavipes]
MYASVDHTSLSTTSAVGLGTSRLDHGYVEDLSDWMNHDFLFITPMVVSVSHFPDYEDQTFHMLQLKFGATCPVIYQELVASMPRQVAAILQA